MDLNTIFHGLKVQNRARPPQPSPNLDPDAVSEALAFAMNLPRCEALRDTTQVRGAVRLTQWSGLPSHHDPRKNWDVMKAVARIRAELPKDARVLDAGASGHSAIHNWLHLLGYTRLEACDLRASGTKWYDERGIRFTQQDLTKTDFEDQAFDAVTSISVVEHGVPLAEFFNEMQRVLRPGGLLIVSTDYWPEPIDCTGIYPYGEEMGEMMVFDQQSMRHLLGEAESAGFEPITPVDLTTHEKVVHWERVDRRYTFIYLAWRKAG